MALELSYKKIGSGPPLIILHGLFGSLDNWMSFARQLEEHRTVYLVDQRNHGQSPHSADFNYDAMAEDLKTFIDNHSLDHPEILGHSMGGKTAMTMAVKYPGHFSKIIVVDIAPKAYPIRHDMIIDALKSVDIQNIKNRNEGEKALAQHIKDSGIRLFLMKNLKRTPEGFTWKINLKAIEENIDRVGEGIEEKNASEKPVLFIRGSKSDYILDEDIITIVSIFPNAEVKTIEGAGHWVHAEKPDELLNLTKEFLQII